MQRSNWMDLLVLPLIVLVSVVPATGADSGTEKVANPEESLSWLASARWIDLTHSFDEQTIYWPTESGFQLHRGPAGFTDGGYYYAANRFAAAEHGGTHIDSPIHFFETGDTVDEIPLRRLIGEGVVVDVSQRCLDNPDYRITVADLQSWEDEHDRTLTDTLVLLRTGWGRFWTDRERYLGTADLGAKAVAKLHFPGLHPDAARWLVEQREIRAVGIDTPSIDHGQSQRFESHVALFAHDVPAFENVADLDVLPDHGFLLIALPMKIADGTGGPLRIVAVVPD